MSRQMEKFIQVGDFLRERCTKDWNKPHDIDLNDNHHPRLCKTCGMKVCPHCWGRYMNFQKHLRECGEWKRTAYVSKHRGHKANWDGDMRLSAENRGG